MAISTKLHQLKRRRTKVVATLGPASSSEPMLEQLIRSGVNVFRLNMSHGDHGWHRESFRRVRAVAERLKEPVGVLADLCGPKIRIGCFDGGRIQVEDGQAVTVTTRDVTGAPGLIPSQYEGLARDVRAGSRILMDDGNIELRVEAVHGSEVSATVVQGGILKDKKGINLPDVSVSAPALTDKDRRDAALMAELGADFVALSFVKSAADVRELRALLPPGAPHVVAKIERPEALEDIDGILEASDAVMIARGDLGVELPPEKVPVAQSQLIDAARAAQRPVIVATQMLESMIFNLRPTRAEVTDVANAVMAGADAVMLSGETASGQHPLEAVRMMDRVAREAESYLWAQGAFGSIGREAKGLPPIPVGDAMARATAKLSRDLLVRAIVVISRGGMTATVTCSARPAAPVLVASPDPATCRRLGLLWGALPVPVAAEEIEDGPAVARRLAVSYGLAQPGDFILQVRGFAAEPERNAPSVTVLQV